MSIYTAEGIRSYSARISIDFETARDIEDAFINNSAAIEALIVGTLFEGSNYWACTYTSGKRVFWVAEFNEQWRADRAVRLFNDAMKHVIMKLLELFADKIRAGSV